VSSSACDSTGLPTCKTDAGPPPPPGRTVPYPSPSGTARCRQSRMLAPAITGGEIWTRTFYRAKATRNLQVGRGVIRQSAT